MNEAECSTRARALASVIEPFAGQVYFSPECHASYADLGFTASPGNANGVALPDGPAYFCSRGSLLGQVPGQLIASAFAVFNPAVVVPAVTYGWTLTDASTIEAARTGGAIGQLRRILGDAPNGIERLRDLLARAAEPGAMTGRPLFAGLLAREIPDLPLGAAWRYADRLREYRGDSHSASWTAAGFDAVEIGLLTELYWALPTKSYIRTRAWSEDELDAALGRLAGRGLIEGGALTEAGRTAREEVELATDRQCRPLIEALGDDFTDVIDLLSPMGHAIRAQHGYPASGPHDLAAARA
ncbi:MAG TPA: hypothetical protein VG435_01430 [Acidimicrobiales bacterium]|jgi:hypothetical protein|nr:hypothetical protein [Acidimicrobiales bacterium]